MHTYIIRRLLLMFPTLIGITIVVFAVMAAAPGGISAQSLVEGQNLEPEVKQAMEKYYNRLYGLDQPAPVQYLRWLNNVSPVGFTFNEENEIEGFSFTKGSDLGTSFRYGRPVLDLIEERLPITLLLNVISIPLIYVIAIAIGVHAATQRGKAFDVGSGVSMLALWSVPTMLAGVLLIGFFASDQYWRWFPTAGLNRREALDMPFMPHWHSLADVLLLFAAIAIALSLFITLSLRGGRLLRTGVMALLGAGLGITMADALPGESLQITYFIIAVLLAFITGFIGYTDYGALRTSMMGMVGLCVGAGVGFYFMQGEFVRGFLLDRVWHLLLPVLCLSYGGFAFLAKLTRSSVLENLLSDYARTARAKGVPDQQVLWRHVFRNSLLPLITVAAGLLPSLLGGSIIVEALFSIDGMGKLAVEAVQTRDRELVLSITLIGTLLSLAGYLIADLCYAIADPRVSYE
ncbi:ABC transporter permease [Candidatus Tenderia electrophaga]|jgi:peptide/nickel transport system permease protein|uniref:ABC transporter permease n=1 Tax=Candidatus Tenderia electrophaga TaxID=1748243 RepID=A0A0S2TEG3_9GAMM|nr:ABC transporter permease [Candidatus Tenderia electrophaga]